MPLQYRGIGVTPGDPGELMTAPDQIDAALAEAVRTGGGPLAASALGLQPQSGSAAQPSRTPAWSHPPSAGRMAPLT
jgi:hypothetical protein